MKTIVFLFRFLFVLLLLLLSITMRGQNKYHVVDAENGESLAGVCMFVSEGKGAWTNDEGIAILDMENGEQVKISCIGYETLILKKSELTNTIRLKPITKSINEVSVESDELLLVRLAKKLNKEAYTKKDHRVPFFSRITLQTTDGNEMVESFIEAGSASVLHALKLYNGQYYYISAKGKNASNLSRTNLHNLFCLGPIAGDDNFWKEYEFPLHQGLTAAWIKKNYQLSSEIYTNDEEEGLRCIKLIPKNNTNVIEGKIYVRPSNYELVCFEGKLISNARVYGKDASVTSHTTISYRINYTTRNGFCEVDNMTFTLTANKVKCHSVMINMDEYDIKNTINWPTEIGRNLVFALDQVGNNPSMDKYLSVMARTEAEDALVKGKYYAMNEMDDEQQPTDDTQQTDKWKNALPQEKVYLHLDNTGYFKGETIWFKAYVVRTDTEKRGNLSNVLHVELVSPKGDVVAHKKLYITQGVGAGSITLDNAVLPTGFYELRAYTRYMTNWSKNACFSRIIPIFREPRKEGDFTPHLDTETKFTETETEKEEKYAFYPEGGYLVKGLPSRIAYIIKGKRGTVEVPASADQKSVEININGSLHTYNLPQAKDEGISLMVDALRDDSLAMDIWATTGIRDKELGYALIHSGKVLTSQLFKTQEHQHFSIARDILPDGVSQITVFDPEGGALADRFVFRCPEYTDSLKIQNTTTTLLPCGKVTMDITSTPYTSLSFSAMDASSVVNGKTGDIKTWMLLGSDIRGYIANPEYYFESDDTEHRKAADLLMMIQGWRRYDWDMMSGYKKPESLQPYESKLAIDGRLRAKKGTNANIAGVKVSATLSDGSENIGVSAVTDSTGYYVLELPDLQGEWSLSISAYEKGISDKYIIPINRHFSPVARHPETFEAKQIPKGDLRIHHWDLPEEDEEVWKKFLDAKGTTMRELTVKHKRGDNFNYSGYSDERDAQITSQIYYDCEQAVEEFLDRGEEPPTLTDWLMGKNQMFKGSSNLSHKAVWNASPNAGEIIDVVALYRSNEDEEDPPYCNWVRVWRDGLTINNRPVIWVVNNLFCSITNLSLPIDKDDVSYAEVMNLIKRPPLEIPELLEDVKSVYLSEDKVLVRKFITSPRIESKDPYVMYCYTRQNQVKNKIKGIRYTSFQGYDPVEVFETEDYSVMPPMNDFRRTLYWNPNVWTDKDGKAHVEFWNNSTCTDMIISAEGVTDDGKFVIGR